MLLIRSWLKRPGTIALICFLSIPIITVLTGSIFSAIDPEIAAGHANYERNYQILTLIKQGCLLVGLFVCLTLWTLTCLFLIKSKRASYFWLFVAVLGPFGVIVLSLLCDKEISHENRHQVFLKKLNIVWRIGYEVCRFLVLWFAAFYVMVLKQELLIAYEVYSTGLAAEVIIERQNASSGMLAFSEGIEILYLVTLFYLLWPIGVNAITRFLTNCLR